MKSLSKHRVRPFLAPLVAIVLALLAAASLVVLERRANGYRVAQATLANASAQFALVSVVPLDLSRHRIALQAADRTVDQTERAVMGRLNQLERTWPVSQLGTIIGHVRASFAAVDRLDKLVRIEQRASRGRGQTQTAVAEGASPTGVSGVSGSDFGTPQSNAIAATVEAEGQAAKRAMQSANRDYDQLASRAQTEALIATLVAIAVLLMAFVVFYFRWFAILRRTERDARSDALTGLGNRRALLERLEEELPRAMAERPLLLTLYDLDGFKAYNDTFGHLAGDALLTRFAQRLRELLGESGAAYRMGGDEFCSLVRVSPDRVNEHVARVRAVLSESGEGFAISCSAGSVLLPQEAATRRAALALADDRMYEHKGLTKRRLEPERTAQAG